jgi:hypothetical protein
MESKYYLVKVEDDPSPKYAGRVRISLFKAEEPDTLGAGCGALTEQNKRGVPYAVKSLFAMQYGNAPVPNPAGKICVSADGDDLMWKPADVDRSQSPGA